MLPNTWHWFLPHKRTGFIQIFDNAADKMAEIYLIHTLLVWIFIIQKKLLKFYFRRVVWIKATVEELPKYNWLNIKRANFAFKPEQTPRANFQGFTDFQTQCWGHVSWYLVLRAFILVELFYNNQVSIQTSIQPNKCYFLKNLQKQNCARFHVRGGFLSQARHPSHSCKICVTETVQFSSVWHSHMETMMAGFLPHVHGWSFGTCINTFAFGCLWTKCRTNNFVLKHKVGPI